MYLDLGIQKLFHDYQMNYDISSDNHKGIIKIGIITMQPFGTPQAVLKKHLVYLKCFKLIMMKSIIPSLRNTQMDL